MLSNHLTDLFSCLIVISLLFFKDVYVTPSGTPYSEYTIHDIVKVGVDGVIAPLQCSKPTSELTLHLAIYAKFPKAKAVCTTVVKFCFTIIIVLPPCCSAVALFCTLFSFTIHVPCLPSLIPLFPLPAGTALSFQCRHGPCLRTLSYPRFSLHGWCLEREANSGHTLCNLRHKSFSRQCGA